MTLVSRKKREDFEEEKKRKELWGHEFLKETCPFEIGITPQNNSWVPWSVKNISLSQGVIITHFGHPVITENYHLIFTKNNHGNGGCWSSVMLISIWEGSSIKKSVCGVFYKIGKHGIFIAMWPHKDTLYCIFFGHRKVCLPCAGLGDIILPSSCLLCV